MNGYGKPVALGGSATAIGILSGQGWMIAAAVAVILVPALVTRLFWRRRKSAFDA